MTWASRSSGCAGETSMVTGCTQQGVSSPEKQRLMRMPSRLHGFVLCWPVTMKAAHCPDNFNPSALGIVAYPNFAPATNYGKGNGHRLHTAGGIEPGETEAHGEAFSSA